MVILDFILLVFNLGHYILYRHFCMCLYAELLKHTSLFVGYGVFQQRRGDLKCLVPQ